jgi:outer membrane protein TolC
MLVLSLAVGTPETTAPVWSLDDCMALAARQNPTAQKALAGIQSARGARTRSLSAVLPTLSLYSDVSKYSSEQISFYQNEIKESRNRYSAGVQLQQPLFDGWYSWASMGSAAASVRAAEHGYRASLGTVALDVAGKFYGVLKADGLLAVAAEAEAVAARLLERAEAREIIGSASRQEVLRAKVQLYTDRMERMRRGNDLKTSRSALLLALGMDPASPFTLLEEELEVPEVPDLAECLADVESHPSLLAAQETAGGARRGVAAARSSRYPWLTGTASYGWSDVELPEDGDEFRDFDYWKIGLTVSMNLFDGFNTKGQIQAARARASDADIAREETRLSLRHSAEVQHNQLVEALAQREVAQAALDLANEEYRLAEEKYTLGSLSFVDLGDSKLALERAKVILVEAVYAVRIASVGLAQARGRLGGSR